MTVDVVKRRKYQRAWQMANSEKVSAWHRAYRMANLERDTAVRRHRKYGLTSEALAELLAKQGGRCAICPRSIVEGFHVDHDHETNVVRGLLCGACNRGLGIFGDDSALLRLAADYLAAHSPKPKPPGGTYEEI